MQRGLTCQRSLIGQAVTKRLLLSKEIGLMRHFTVSESVHLLFMVSGSDLVLRSGRRLGVITEVDEQFRIMCAKLHVRSRMIGQAPSHLFVCRSGVAHSAYQVGRRCNLSHRILLCIRYCTQDPADFHEALLAQKQNSRNCPEGLEDNTSFEFEDLEKWKGFNIIKYKFGYDFIIHRDE